MTRPKAPKTKTTPGQSPPTSPMPGSRKRGADAGSPAKDKAAAEVVDLEKRRLAVAEELRHVEQQIYDLETKYLETSSPFGNAVRGYEGFLGGSSVANRKMVLKPEERLFSWSSVSGQTLVKQ
uniref:Chromatin modification-related protein MEAF6 n=1 Tax=Auxenochlorella protothecoides TaxID=3075 RepID=A0A1D2A1Z3_AUXPR